MASKDQANEPTWGPGNPHPLSQLQAELVWEGKYDEFGNRRTVDAAGLAMPILLVVIGTLLVSYANRATA